VEMTYDRHTCFPFIQDYVLPGYLQKLDASMF
jgi:hypothetical protein